jgi:hypothetical protein
VWISKIQSRLTNLQRSLEHRIERRSPTDGGNRWRLNVRDFLVSFEKAKEVRGTVVGRNLAELAAQFKSLLTGDHPLSNKVDGVTLREAGNNLEAVAVAQEYGVSKDDDGAVISSLDEKQSRDGLSLCELRLSQVITEIAAQQQAFALMTMRGDQSERKLWPIRNKLRDGLERQNKLVRLRDLYGQRLQILSAGDYDKERNAVGKKEEPIFIPSEDYRSIKYKGILHRVTRNQATIVKLLHKAHINGTPALGKEVLLAAIEAETSRVRDSFKGSRLWGTLVVTNRSPRGTYQLNLR